MKEEPDTQEDTVAEEQEGKSLDELADKGQIAAPTTEEEIMKPVVFKEGCFGMRADIELLKSKALNWMKHPEFENKQTHERQHSEMKANIMLAYRHLEDARMRIGKAIQAYEGGKSILPR